MQPTISNLNAHIVDQSTVPSYVPSKSLLSVRGIKGRVSYIKKVFAANWFYFSPEFQNFAPQIRVQTKKKGLCRILFQSSSGISDLNCLNLDFASKILLNLDHGACFQLKARIYLVLSTLMQVRGRTEELRRCSWLSARQRSPAAQREHRSLARDNASLVGSAKEMGKCVVCTTILIA